MHIYMYMYNKIIHYLLESSVGLSHSDAPHASEGLLIVGPKQTMKMTGEASTPCIRTVGKGSSALQKA